MSKHGDFRHLPAGTSSTTGPQPQMAAPRLGVVGNKRILVADEDPVTARFLKSLLEREGYEVTLAEDGERALELTRLSRPHLILSDLTMPYRDGYGLLREIRQDEKLAGIPLIILSVRDREADIVRGFDEGADDYIVKPFHSRELLARIRHALTR